jgi:hypothetical protein
MMVEGLRVAHSFRAFVERVGYRFRQQTTIFSSINAAILSRSRRTCFCFCLVRSRLQP